MSSPDSDQTKPAGKPARTVKRLVLASLGMFAFGFLLVPLYDVFCDITGLNGKTSGKAYALEDGLLVDKSRWVTVQFLTNTNANMSWEFEAAEHKVRVHPGELRKVSFTVINPTTQRMTAQAVPSVSPSEGAEYLLKTQCFCFEQQELNPGANQQMTLLFRVDPKLPEHIGTLTLAYTLFDITSRTDNAQALALLDNPTGFEQPSLASDL
ncbi:cytochrome c oxidase assembly protein [Oceanospirillum sp. HFRX-1_2]